MNHITLILNSITVTYPGMLPMTSYGNQKTLFIMFSLTIVNTPDGETSKSQFELALFNDNCIQKIMIMIDI